MRLLLEILNRHSPFISLGEETEDCLQCHVCILESHLVKHGFEGNHEVLEVELHASLQVNFLIQSAFEILQIDPSFSLLVKVLE